MKPVKNIALLLMLLSAAITTYSQDTINWRPSYKLNWQDFKAKPDAQSSYAAITDCSINYSFSYTNDSLSYKILSYFNKNKSWSKSTNDTFLLKHEQGHFDINEIFARKLKKAFKEYKFTTAVNTDLQAIFNKNWQDKIAFDNLYDQQTDHSKNKAKQLEWSKKIADELTKLNSFKY